MRVLHICELFLTGGIESLVLDLCAALQPFEVQSRIAVCYGQVHLGTAPPRHPTPVIRLRMKRGVRIEPWGLHRLGCEIRRFSPDVLHCQSYYGALAGLLLRLAGLHVPIVFTVQANIYRGAQRSDFVIQHVIRRCDRVVAVSSQAAAAVETFMDGAIRPEVILNGTDLRRTALRENFDRAAKQKQLGIRGNPIVFLTVARLTREKDHPTLFCAFSQALADLGEAYLLVAGDGPERPALEKLARELGLGERIQFLGERNDVGELLASADVFVLSSHNEGLPISVIEACCAGVPVVASQVGGLADMTAAGLDILLTTPEDAGSLRDALLSLSDAEQRERRGRHLKERARQEFCIERTARQYMALYEQVLSETPGETK